MTQPPKTPPPPWPTRLLSPLLPEERRDEIVGDLLEEKQLGGHGRAWYALQLGMVALRLALAGTARGSLWTDARLGLRRLRTERGFAGVALTAVAVGIGLNVVILSVARTVLFAPLPYPHEDRLAVLTNEHTGSSTGGFGVSWLNMRDVAERSRTVERFSLFLDWQDLNVTEGDEAWRIPAAFVDSTYFPLLGLSAGRGRLPTAAENREGAWDRVAVLGRGTWERSFGSDPDVVGRTLHLNGVPYRVVGVLADDRGDLRHRWGVDPAGVFLPLFAAEELTGFELQQHRGVRTLNALLRLREDASVAAARADLQGLSRELAELDPDRNAGWTYEVQPLDEAFFESLRAPAGALLAGSILVLLLVALNVTGLLLVRATGRGRELAVRQVLGAGSGRLLRQLLTEGLVLATAGGLLGGMLAALGLMAVGSADILSLPSFSRIEAGSGVVLLAAGAVVGLGTLFGIVPGVQLLRRLRRSGASDLRAGRDEGSGQGAGRLRTAFTVGQIALAFALLVGAGLMLESFRTLRSTGYGFDTRDLVLLRMRASEEHFASDDALRAFAETLVERGGSLPGVEASFLWSPNRLGHGNEVDLLAREGRWQDNPAERLEASRHLLLPGTLERVGIPLLAGRDVTAGDDAEAPLVALVSESLGKTLWPGEDPVGKRVETSQAGEIRQARVVGVVADARHRTRLTEPFGPQRDIYYPYAQAPAPGLTLALRAAPGRSVAGVSDGARALLRDLAPLLPVESLVTMSGRMRREEAPTRLTASLVGLYALLAVALAALGVYGVLAHGVRARTREMGVRMALGADATRLLRAVVGEGLLILLAGCAGGATLAWAGGAFLRSALYGVEPDSPLVFLAVAVLLGGVGVVATVVPALRVARIDPSEALRGE